MPNSNVAWRFFLASAEFRRGDSKKKAPMKQKSNKAKKSMKATQTKAQSTVLKKPSAKVSAMKVQKRKSPMKTSTPPCTPNRKTKPGDGTTPWSQHYAQ